MTCAHELLRLANSLDAHGLGTQWRGISREACEHELRSLEEEIAFSSFALQGALGMRM